MKYKLAPPPMKYSHLIEQKLKDRKYWNVDDQSLIKDKFWILRLTSIVVFSILLTVPFYIISFIQNYTKKKKSVKGKVVLITGAARGLGRSLALQMSSHGAKVVCADMNEEGNKETAAMIKERGGEAEAYTVNVAITEDIAKLKSQISKRFGEVDILINNAALLIAVPVEDWEEEEIRIFYEINLLSHLWMIKTFLPSMRERKTGHIVTISSAASFAPTPFLTIYGSSKAAITNLTDCLRCEMGLLDEPIKFTSVHPAYINTSLEVVEFSNMRLPIIRAEQAAKDIVDAILLEKENVSLPSHIGKTAFLLKILPNIFEDFAGWIINPTVIRPIKLIRRAMPSQNIVEKMSKEKKK